MTSLVVISETATGKTIEQKIRSFHGLDPFSVAVMGSATGISSVMALSGGSLLLSAGIVAAGLFSATFGGIKGETAAAEVLNFNGEKVSDKELKRTVPSGTRMKIGKSKYSSQNELGSAIFSDMPQYRNYEFQLFVRNTEGKLTVEYEISELPKYSWEVAYQSLLENDGIKVASADYSECWELKAIAEEAEKAKQEYIKNSAGFSFDKV